MRYLVGKDLDLPIHGASSLVRSLSGLDIYLRRGLAQENALLIIDEPEMNAHPDAQLAVCELLAILVNQGVQVLVTTHSPYFVDHLNNLIEASQLDESLKGAFAKKFKMQTKDAFLSPDQVAVYDFQEETSGQGDVTVKDIFDRENRLIDWGTFGKVTDYSSDLYSELIDKTLQQEIPHAAD